MRVTVVDYGLGNLRSVYGAIKYLGADVSVSRDAASILASDKLVLPGVGAFKAGMERLSSCGLIEVLHEAVKVKNIPVLGICLGAQIMATQGEEDGLTPGLGWIEASVVKMRPTGGEPLPHIGWNQVHVKKTHPAMEGLRPEDPFYFVHSYHVRLRDPALELATVDYGGTVTAAFQDAHILGVQFHPEKSQKAGLKLLENYLCR